MIWKFLAVAVVWGVCGYIVHVRQGRDAEDIIWMAVLVTLAVAVFV